MTFSLFFFLFITVILNCCIANQLLMVQTIFRHGDRAPTRGKISKEGEKIYFRGAGQLTDLGVQQSNLLGDVLKKRYVDKFIDGRMLPTEISFRSSDSERALMTAQAVGSAMFNNIPVPVFTTERKNDYVCFSKDCSFVFTEMKKELGMNSSTEEFYDILDERSRQTARELNSTVFMKDENISLLEKYIFEWTTGQKVPIWFDKKAFEEAEKIWYKSLSFMIGSDEFHNIDWLRTRSGYLLHTLISNMEQMIECQKNNSTNCKLKKFYAFSTHDVVLMAVLDSFNMTQQALGKGKLSDYTSSLTLELWIQKGIPEVKILYRRNSEDEDFVTMILSSGDCIGLTSCPLPIFKESIKEYISSNIETFCQKR